MKKLLISLALSTILSAEYGPITKATLDRSQRIGSVDALFDVIAKVGGNYCFFSHGEDRSTPLSVYKERFRENIFSYALDVSCAASLLSVQDATFLVHMAHAHDPTPDKETPRAVVGYLYGQARTFHNYHRPEFKESIQNILKNARAIAKEYKIPTGKFEKEVKEPIMPVVVGCSIQIK